MTQPGASVPSQPEDDLLVVYSISNSPYQEWQAELLDFSVRATSQPGTIVRLCSPDGAFPGRPVPHTTHAVTFATESFSGLGRGPVPGLVRRFKRGLGMPLVGRFEFPCLNKPFGMRAFLQAHDLRDDARLLWLDPDMIFHRPWLPPRRESGPGHVCGQRWWGYDDRWFRDALTERERAALPRPEDAIMFPFCLHAADMRRIVDSFCELTLRIYRRTRDWKSEMAALVVSLGQAGIEPHPIPNLAPCNNWPDGLPDDPDAPIAHYTQAMRDESGAEMWDKRRYTPSTHHRPWGRPPSPHRAATRSDRRTLQMLHRWIDAQELGSDLAERPAPVGDARPSAGRPAEGAPS